MIEPVENLDKITVLLNQGVNELAASTQLPLSNFVKLENWRITSDGNRLEKRGGLSLIEYSTFGGHDIFGYHTYVDASSNFCQIAVCEDKVYRKIGSASWAAIKTWSTTLAHPVFPFEIQGKQIFVNENQNFVILSDGTVTTQFGITAPASVPTVTASYDATLLDEDMAAITDWDDDDVGGGASTQVTFDSKSCMKLLNTANPTDLSMRSRVIDNMGSEYSVEMSIYFDLLGTYQKNNHFEFQIYNGRVIFKMMVDTNDIYVWSGKYWVSAGAYIQSDKWYTLKFYVDSRVGGDEYAEIFLDGVPVGHFNVNDRGSATPGETRILLYGYTVASSVYIDSIKVGSTTGGNINGFVRYAVTYARGGDYGYESNPIYGLVGSKAFTGSGVNDLTFAGDYSGGTNKTFVVKVDSVGATDTIKWSEDNGATWHSTGIPMTSKIYLPYEITITCATTTGHTLNDYWTFTCYAISVDACHQKVTLTSIPVSSDTQVNQRKIYRTLAGGTTYYLVAIINDNVTTTFVDNIPQETVALGDVMELDHDLPPTGYFAVWWDDRLWIADEIENIVYYSNIEEPEHFDILDRWVSVRSGESYDRITGLVPYKGNLYIFKKNSVAQIRKKQDGTYGRYWVCKDFGNIAPSSLRECGGLLLFLSHRGWEVFNGCESYSVLFSREVRRTLSLIDKSSNKLDLICSSNCHDFYETWLSIPDLTTGTACTIVCNITGPAFYIFRFNKVPSVIAEARNSSGVMKTYVGTRDGYLYETENGTQDGTTNITATARLPWAVFPVSASFRRLELEIEAPTSTSLTVNVYRNMEYTAVASRTISGKTPTSTDDAFRYPIHDFLEFNVNTKELALEFTNAENVAALMKINMIQIWYYLITKKGRIAPS